jgi:hypothetical protein
MLERRPGEIRSAGVLRVDWLPGVGLLAASVGSGAVLGYTAGAGRPPLYLSATVCALILGLAAFAWRSRPRPTVAATRGRISAPTATPHVPIDLSRDRTTDAQKYVM